MWVTKALTERLFECFRLYLLTMEGVCFMRYVALLVCLALFVTAGCTVTSQTKVCYKAPPVPKLDFKRHIVPIYVPRLRLEIAD